MLLRTIMPCLRNEQVYDFEKQKKEKTLIKKKTPKKHVIGQGTNRGD